MPWDWALVFFLGYWNCKKTLLLAWIGLSTTSNYLNQSQESDKKKRWSLLWAEDGVLEAKGHPFWRPLSSWFCPLIVSARPRVRASTSFSSACPRMRPPRPRPQRQRPPRSGRGTRGSLWTRPYTSDVKMKVGMKIKQKWQSSFQLWTDR